MERKPCVASLAIAPRSSAVARPAHSSARAPLACASCSVHRACLAWGLTPGQLERFSALATSKRRIFSGARLARAGEPLQALYVLHSGALKVTSSCGDGREKVTGFCLPGDMVGLEGVESGAHAYDVASLEDSNVCVIPFDALQQLSHATPALLQQLFCALSADISRDHGLVLLLGGMTAEERVTAFLLSLSRRYQRLGYAADRFRLRMTRRDIASYLGLSLETVCRVLSRLQRERLVMLQQREMRLLDFDALRAIVSAWERPRG